MTRAQLIQKTASKIPLSAKQVETVLDTLIDEIIESLAHDEKVKIIGLGRFEMRYRAAKSYTNPKTREKRQLPPFLLPSFTASGLLRERIEARREEINA